MLDRQMLMDQAEKGLERLEQEDEFYFYGVSHNCFKIDDMVLAVISDPDDGYRSYFGTLLHADKETIETVNFFSLPLGRVVLEECSKYTENPDGYSEGESFNGWHLRDLDTNHIWLQFGTGRTDAYYPYFVFYYDPDKTQQNFAQIKPDYIPFKQRNPELLVKYPEWFSGEKMFDFQYD